jgi:drug/metabolite transporter (DMT)-like permease
MSKEHLVDMNTGSFTLLYLKGAAFAVCAMLIWASWGAMTRLAVTTTLSPWDIAALRFGVAGILLAPVLLRRGLALDRLGWPGLVALIVGGGAPYALVAAAGLRFAPASDQGALKGEWPSSSDWVGILLVSFGVYFTSGRHSLGGMAGNEASFGIGSASFCSGAKHQARLYKPSLVVGMRYSKL